MVEVWMLTCLIMPFVEVVLQTYIQAWKQESRIENLADRKSQKPRIQQINKIKVGSADQFVGSQSDMAAENIAR
jgi:hypothetical protein